MKKITRNNVFIQNNFIDDILENPDNYDYCQIMLISSFTPYRYKLFDYMLLNYAYDEDSDTFRDYLFNSGLYNDYSNNSANGDDVILKANLAIFIENRLFNPFFDNISNFIEKVSSCEKYAARYKIGLLIAITSFKCRKEDIINIKEKIKQLMLNDEEYKNEFSKKELMDQLIDYYKQIDLNQSEEKVYILNK